MPLVPPRTVRSIVLLVVLVWQSGWLHELVVGSVDVCALVGRPTTSNADDDDDDDDSDQKHASDTSRQNPDDIRRDAVAVSTTCTQVDYIRIYASYIFVFVWESVGNSQLIQQNILES